VSVGKNITRKITYSRGKKHKTNRDVAMEQLA